jgi:hypothetical protein
MEASEIRKLASESLNEHGQESIDALLDEGKIDSAIEYLLGALDAYFERGVITFETAAEYYKILGVSSERASRLRQARVRNKGA